MGIFGVLMDGVKELTGVNSLNRIKEKYNDTVVRYNDKVQLLNKNIITLNKLVEEVNKEKQKCVDLINLYGLIDKKNKQVDLSHFEAVLDDNKYDMSRITSGSGIGASVIAGGILSFGTYTFVSIFGTASTGTAIASLSGVAATNATLAALGGGALAVGGGGMAAGTTALGVIAIVPLALYSFSNYSKVSKYKEEIEKIEEQIEALRPKSIAIERIIKDNIHLKERIIEEREKFNNQMVQIVKTANKTTKDFVGKLRNLTKDFNGNTAIGYND